MSRWLMLMLAVAPLAGCMGPAPAGDGAAPMGDPSAADWPASLPQLPLDPALRNVVLEDCTGMMGGFSLPLPLVQDDVPEGFTPFILVPGHAELIVAAHSCAKATVGDVVTGPFAMVYTMFDVYAENESWAPDRVPVRVFIDCFVSDGDVAHALDALGLEAREVDIGLTRLGAEVVEVVWSLTDGGASMTIQYPYIGSGPKVGDFRNYFFAGNDPYVRLDWSGLVNADYLGVTAGTIQFAGLGKTASYAQDASWPLLANPAPVGQFTGSIPLEYFSSEED